MPRFDHSLAVAALAILLAAALPASGHVSLETKEAPAGSTYKAVLRVSHGCNASPTVAVRVRIPDGVIGVKPMPKPGWQLSTVMGAPVQPYTKHDGSVTSVVKEIAWTGGRLLDGYYDEFVFRATLPDMPAGTVIHMPVVQQCEQGIHRWIEIPESGKSRRDYKEPAPSVTLIGTH